MKRKSATALMFAVGIFFLASFAIGEDEKSPESAPAPAADAPIEGDAGASDDQPSEEPPSPDEEGLELAEAQESPLDQLYSGLTKDTLSAKGAERYAPDVRFEDPFGKYEGRDATLKHLGNLLDEATELNFEIKEEFVSSDETVALWVLKLKHDDLNDGDEIVIDGATHYRTVGGKIIYQRDHYDLGALVYENIWLFGAVVKWIRGKGA